MEVIKDENSVETPANTNKIQVYDPAKKYNWTPQTQFVLNGEEFGTILNSLRSLLNLPEAQPFVLANRANEMVEKVFAKAVERGDATEA